MEQRFLDLCKTGYLDKMKKLLDTYKINIHMHDEYGFKWALYSNHLHVIKYLVNLHTINTNYSLINIQIKDMSGFRWGAKWIDKRMYTYLCSIGNHWIVSYIIFL